MKKVALELSEEARKEGGVYDANGTFRGTLTTPDKMTWEEAEARGLTWGDAKKLPPVAIEQIRQIVREEIAAAYSGTSAAILNSLRGTTGSSSAIHQPRSAEEKQ
ncbi:hypothetical protein [Paenibacillus senegalimassiliensis]|uniref:hypothetical protein n=1 Tax=Paenibacillus senegalimassiliensis TaxID=1737426 RepID=UPI000AF7942D|nr:hypothetical protein [Paenibacillus senegalimassiliensis]